MTVEPIKNKKKIQEIQKYLKAKNLRDYLLFVIGTNTGRRISDILKLQVKDVMDDQGNIKEFWLLTEQKTKKQARIKLNSKVRQAIKEYIATLADYNMDTYLFASRKGGKPITRQHAWLILKDAADATGLDVIVGTHTLRKTWGYHAYEASEHNIGLIMDALNHSTPKHTLRYIGISQKAKDALMEMVQI